MSKFIILVGLTLMFGAGCALAQTNQMNAGRPSAILKPERCDELWKKAVPSGDKLARANAAPFIVNFSQIDTDIDGSIDYVEFKAACAKGMVKDTGQ